MNSTHTGMKRENDEWVSATGSIVSITVRTGAVNDDEFGV